MDICPQIFQTIREHAMIARGERVLLAVSGGPDSMAMLHALMDLRESDPGWFEAHVAHLHHGIRGAEADRDADFVAERCRGLGLPCHIERADVPQIARASRTGLEAAARRVRYDFLRRTAEQIGAASVATAHHADDNVETVLLRVARGMAFRALAGIRPVRPLARGCAVRIIRPLIECRRGDIEAYLAARSLPWRADSSNALPFTRRNRIRLQVLPRLQRRLPGLAEAILSGIRAFRGAHQALAAQSERALAQAPVSAAPQGVRFPAAWLARLGERLAGEVLHTLLLRLIERPDALSRGHHEAVLDLCRRPLLAPPVSLPCGWRACVEDAQCVISRPEPEPDRGTHDVPVDLSATDLALPGFRGRLLIRCGPATPDTLARFLARRTPLQALLDADALRGRLAVRAWRPGDRMQPLGAPGVRKLQDIFTDLKLPRLQRLATPILTLDDEPVWIIGHCIADRVKVSPITALVAEFAFLPSPGVGP